MLISNQTSSLLRSLCILSLESTISQMKCLHIYCCEAPLTWISLHFKGFFIEILDEVQVWSHYMVNYLPVCHNSVSSTCTGTLCMWEIGWRRRTLKYLNWHFCFSKIFYKSFYISIFIYIYKNECVHPTLIFPHTVCLGFCMFLTLNNPSLLLFGFF